MNGCPYCTPDGPDGPYNDEHVIPAKLGGNLVIRAHEKCNSQSALFIDNPLMANPDVEMLRGLSGVVNTRTGRRRGSQFVGLLEDDARALLRADSGEVVLEQVGVGDPQVADEDGLFTFTLPHSSSPATIEKQTERVLAELRDRFPGKTVELVNQERRKGTVKIERSWNLDPAVWPRFVAKIALGVLHQTMPAAWRGSEGELFLLFLFRVGNVITVGNSGDGLAALPTTLDQDDAEFRPLYPWEHAITVHPRTGGVSVTVVLFGELKYQLSVATPLRPIGPTVWLCDYREQHHLEFETISKYAEAVTIRYADFGDFAHLRPERPRGQLLGPQASARLRPLRLDPQPGDS